MKYICSRNHSNSCWSDLHKHTTRLEWIQMENKALTPVIFTASSSENMCAGLWCKNPPFYPVNIERVEYKFSEMLCWVNKLQKIGLWLTCWSSPSVKISIIIKNVSLCDIPKRDAARIASSPLCLALVESEGLK